MQIIEGVEAGLIKDGTGMRGVFINIEGVMKKRIQDYRDRIRDHDDHGRKLKAGFGSFMFGI
jgi:hypothetical protein